MSITPELNRALNILKKIDDIDTSDLFEAILNHLINQEIPNPFSSKWIDIPFDATNFTGEGSLVWTVGSGDQDTYKYKLLDTQTMILVWRIVASTLATTANSQVRIALPRGYTVRGNGSFIGSGFYQNNGNFDAALIRAISGESFVRLINRTAANFTLETNLFLCAGFCIMEVGQ